MLVTCHPGRAESTTSERARRILAWWEGLAAEHGSACRPGLICPERSFQKSQCASVCARETGWFGEERRGVILVKSAQKCIWNIRSGFVLADGGAASPQHTSNNTAFGIRDSMNTSLNSSINIRYQL